MCIVLGYMQNYDGCYERVERGGVRGGDRRRGDGSRYIEKGEEEHRSK